MESPVDLELAVTGASLPLVTPAPATPDGCEESV